MREANQVVPPALDQLAATSSGGGASEYGKERVCSCDWQLPRELEERLRGVARGRGLLDALQLPACQACESTECRCACAVCFVGISCC
jgi:hypothetical protein